MKLEASGAAGDPGARGLGKARPGRHSCPPHPALAVEFRRRKAVGGGESFVRQCTACGAQVGGPVPLSRVPDPRAVPRFDARRAHRPQPNSKRREYAKHLKSAYWKNLRKRRFAMDQYQCQVKVGAGICGQVAEELAHLTYERFGRELISDVQSQCARHNREEREHRIARHVLGPTEPAA